MEGHGLGLCGTGCGQLFNSCERGSKSPGSIKCGERLDQLRNCQLLKDCAPCSQLVSQYVSWGSLAVDFLNNAIWYVYFNFFFSKRLFLKIGVQKRVFTGRCRHRGEAEVQLQPIRRRLVVSTTPRPLYPRKTRYPLYRKLGSVSGLLCTSKENLATTGIRTPGRPAHSKTLYRLSYSGVLTVIKSEDTGNGQLYVSQIK